MPVPITTVSAHFDEAMFHTVTFILASADRARTITYEPLVRVHVNSACFPKETIRCQSVLLCQLTSASFQDSSRRDGKRDNQRAVRCVVSFGIRAGEAIIVIWFMVYI